METHELSKLYYSIGEVSELFSVAPSLIRYWESEFPLLKPGKNSKGDRKYTVKDIETIKRIYILVKERGFTIEGANKELELQKKEAKKSDVLAKKLKDLRKKIVAFKKEFE